MTRKHTPYKTYIKEFKEEAVQLMESSNWPAAQDIPALRGIRRIQARDRRQVII
jgi:hypothetical protein